VVVVDDCTRAAQKRNRKRNEEKLHSDARYCDAMQCNATNGYSVVVKRRGHRRRGRGMKREE